PWFAFYPRLARHTAGVIMVLFQVVLILSGNLSFLNWLTIVPALACFDDGLWSKILPHPFVRRAEVAAASAGPGRPMGLTAWVVACRVAILSIQPVANML